MSHFLGMMRAYGLGALSDDLSSFDTTVSTGDSAIAAGNWAGAVIAYQAAGQSGATSLGPSIDSATNAVSQPLTQQAWSINGNLQAVNNGYNDASSGGSVQPSQSDAQNAQGFARQMSNLYHTALSQAASGAGGGGGAPATPSSALVSTANGLVAWLQTNGCTTSSVSQVVAFQTSYNNEGSIALTVDGKYGPATQGALQRVLTASGGGTAPQNCFSGGGGAAPPSSGGGGGAGGGGGGAVVPAQASMMPWGATALVVAAAVAVGYELYQRKAHKKFGRRIGHHARRLHHGLRHRLMRRRHHA